MALVSITRLRIRRWRFLPPFLRATSGALRQVRTASGFRAGSVLMDGFRTFWTVTLWASEADMRAYMTSGAHRSAMPKLLDWCDEAAIAHGAHPDGADLPTWEAAADRLRTEGRPSRVRHPSRHHATLQVREPRRVLVTAIRP